MLPILGIPFHYPWLKIGSKQTALGCSCKQSVWYEQEELLQAPFLWQSQHNCVTLHF